jgi:hypothetical protein
LNFLLCDKEGCDGFFFAGQPVQTGAVNVFKSEQKYLQVWSTLSLAFPAVHLPHQPTTSLDYSTREDILEATAHRGTVRTKCLLFNGQIYRNHGFHTELLVLSWRF